MISKVYEYKDMILVQIDTLNDQQYFKNLSNGNVMTVEEPELLKETTITAALPKFFDAQWIGVKDLEKMTIAMQQEVSEALNELDWKPWKAKPVNMEAYKQELADVGIFLLLCAKTADMTLDELLLEMFEKHLYNLIRKDHKPRG